MILNKAMIMIIAYNCQSDVATNKGHNMFCSMFFLLKQMVLSETSSGVIPD